MALNNYVAKPFEQNVAQPVEQAYLSYLLSRASQSLSQPTLSGLQPAGNQAYHLPTGIGRTIAENAPELLLESLMPQTVQSPSTSEAIPENEIAYNLLNQYLQANINKYSSPSAPGNTYWGTNSAGQPVYEYFNPSLWANRLAQLGLGIPGMTQNYGRGLIGSLEAVPSALFGTHYPNIPAAPSYETAPAEKYLSTIVPNYISNFVNAGVGGANPGETAFNNYVAKPFEQYVASPAEQVASYVASRLYPALSNYPKDVSLQQVNPLMINMSPSGLLSNTLTSYLQPYLNNGARNINNFLSGLQNGVNQWAATPYNPSSVRT